MRLEVRFVSVMKTNAVAEYVERQVGFTLGRFFSRISSVTAWFDDVSGSDRTYGKRCLVEAKGEFGTLIARAQGPDFCAAAKRALDVLERAVARALGRRRRLVFSNHGDDISSVFVPTARRTTRLRSDARVHSATRLRPPSNRRGVASRRDNAAPAARRLRDDGEE